ncbi:MAG: hypothetical protein ACM3VS_15585 [Candidatus Dadabacteria bacterium]
MEKSPKTGAQIYGYTVCVVAVITFLICITTLMNAFFDMQDPIHSGFYQGPSLASYETYKMDVLKNTPKTDAAYVVPNEQTLRAMYQSARDDKIVSVKNRARRDFVISSVLILICATLFITHWRWIRKMNKAQNVAPVAAKGKTEAMLVDN